MTDAWQRRLKRLGVTKGARQLRAPDPPPRELRPAPEPPADADEPAPLARLLPGLRVEENEAGGFLVLDRVYPLSHRHGEDRVGALLEMRAGIAAPVSRDERFADLEFRDVVFLDTETTGLSGAGVLAFMVGVAYYEGGAFVARQYFLRDHDDEPAMLLALETLLASRAALVTFNGRTFDVPLIDRRYLLNRVGHMVGVLPDMPHLDLLPPARRLWRERSGSCSLLSLEQNVLSLQRDEADVPGWLIPRLYADFLQTGDGREMARVFYHNRLDLVSMATLAHRLLRQFSQPDPEDAAADLISLARWRLGLGDAGAAEHLLRSALEQDLALDRFRQATGMLAGLLKRGERRDEAVVLWHQLAAISTDDITAHVELAKHHEWQTGDLDQAERWTEEALRLARHWAPARATMTLAELEHRLARLRRKNANAAEAPDPGD